MSTGLGVVAMSLPPATMRDRSCMRKRNRKRRVNTLIKCSFGNLLVLAAAGLQKKKNVVDFIQNTIHDHGLN